MIEHEELIDDEVENPIIRLNEVILELVINSAKWAKFISIVGFVFSALFIFLGLFSSSIYRGIPITMIIPPEILFTVVYLSIGLVILLVSLYLFRFGKRAQNGIQDMNQIIFTDGIENLKKYFKSAGITLIVILSIYVIIFLFALIGFASI